MSRAKTTFTAARPDISELFATANRLPDRITQRRRMSAQENQLRLITVALIASLQAYVSELLEEKADEMGDDWDSLSDAQKRYVAVQARRRLDAALTKCEEGGLAEPSNVEPLRKSTMDCASWFTKPSQLARSAYRDKLDGFLQDNGSSALNQAVSRLGNSEMKFFDWLAKHHPRFRGAEDQLNVLIATRNDVAHGTFERRLTMRETRIFRVLIYRLVEKIEAYTGANGTADPTRSSPGTHKASSLGGKAQ